jgi:hypothetical protein
MTNVEKLVRAVHRLCESHGWNNRFYLWEIRMEGGPQRIVAAGMLARPSAELNAAFTAAGIEWSYSKRDRVDFGDPAYILTDRIG